MPFCVGLKEDVLAGQEWGFVLSVLGGTIRDLRTLVYQEEDYLQKAQNGTLQEGAKKLAQNWFFTEEVSTPLALQHLKHPFVYKGSVEINGAKISPLTNSFFRGHY